MSFILNPGHPKSFKTQPLLLRHQRCLLGRCYNLQRTETEGGRTLLTCPSWGSAQPQHQR